MFFMKQIADFETHSSLCRQRLAFVNDKLSIWMDWVLASDDDRNLLGRRVSEFGLKPLKTYCRKIGADFVAQALQRLGAVIDRLASNDNKVYAAVVAVTGDIQAVEILNRRPLGFGK